MDTTNEDAIISAVGIEQWRSSCDIARELGLSQIGGSRSTSCRPVESVPQLTERTSVSKRFSAEAIFTNDYGVKTANQHSLLKNLWAAV
jgi:hypothetical protein